MWCPATFISGAQTGADRAGLDAGKRLGVFTGGTVPKGRRTEDGTLSDEDMERYALTESDSASYSDRTYANVRNSEGTVIFGRTSSPGSRLTISACRHFRRPYIENPSAEQLREWAAENEIETLNVAGNRESGNPGIYQRTLDTLIEAFRAR